MKKLNLLIAQVLLGFIVLNAQTDETKEKLKYLEGEVTKITIETEDDEVEITGDDAELLFKKMKSKKNFLVKKFHDGDMDKHGNVLFFKEGDHHGAKEIKLDIKIDDSDGEKIVVIKKIVDGKETVKEFKGDAAEKFMKNHSKGEHTSMFITDDGEEVHVIMELDGDDVHCISEDGEHDVMKKIKIEESDGVKNITVTTTEDGKESVEVYEGEDAEEFLEKHSEGANKMIFISEDDDLTTISMDFDDLHLVSKGDHKGIMKKVNVEVEAGVKTVTVTTTDDGEETVKVYTGNEADEYLEKMEHGKKMKIRISEDGEKKTIKKKMIIIEKEDDDKD